MEEKKPNGTNDNELLDPNDFDENDSDKSKDDDKSKDEGDKDSKSTNPDGKSTEELEKEEKAKKDAHFAELRRKKEAKEKAEKEEAERKSREQKIRDEATLKAKLDVVKKNPYTDEPITDEEDLRIYEIQKQLDDEGKDPNSDLPKRLAEISRKEKADRLAKEKAESEAKSNREKQIAEEITELRNKYPKLNTAVLADDPLYQKCMEGRVGRWTQVEIYEFYLEEKAKADKKAEDDKKKDTVDKNGKHISSTPSSSANGKTSSKKVSEMTKEEFDAYWKSL